MAYMSFQLGMMLWTVSNARADCTVEVFEGRYFCIYDGFHGSYENAMLSCSNNFAHLPSWDDIGMDYFQNVLIRKLENSRTKIAWLSDPGTSFFGYEWCAAVQVIFSRITREVYFWHRDYLCTRRRKKPHTICVCYDNCAVPLSGSGRLYTESVYPDTEAVSESVSEPVNKPVSGPVAEPTLWTDFYPMPSDMPDFIPQTGEPIIVKEADIFDEDTTAISELTSTSDREIAPFNDRQMSEKRPQIGAIAGGVTVAVLVVIAIIVYILIIYKRKQKMAHEKSNKISTEPESPTQNDRIHPSTYEHLSIDDTEAVSNDAKYEAINVAFIPGADYVNETSVTDSEVPHDNMIMDGHKKNQTNNEIKIGTSNYQNVFETGDYQNTPKDVNPPPVYANM